MQQLPAGAQYEPATLASLLLDNAAPAPAAGSGIAPRAGKSICVTTAFGVRAEMTHKAGSYPTILIGVKGKKPVVPDAHSAFADELVYGANGFLLLHEIDVLQEDIC